MLFRSMSQSLAQQRPRPFRVSLNQRLLGQLAKIMRGDPAALDLYGGWELVKNLQGVGPVTLRLVDPDEVIERGFAIFARGRQLLQEPLRAVHEAGTQVIQGKRERRLVAQGRASLVTKAGVNSDGAVDFAAAPEEAPERELNFGGVVIGLRHARENLGGMVEAVIDEMVEADVVIARQAHSARRSHPSPEKPGGSTNGDEGQREQKWRQLEHVDVFAESRLRRFQRAQLKGI